MKKINLVMIISLLILFPVMVIAECSEEQAFNRMMEMQQHSNKMQMEITAALNSQDPAANTKIQKFQEFSTRLGSGGQLLADKKYTEACNLYASLSKDYGFKLGQGNTLSVADLKKDGGRSKGNGRCDLADAALRMGHITEAFQKKFESGQLSQVQQRQFSDQTTEIGTMMNSNPSQACDMMDGLESRFALR